MALDCTPGTRWAEIDNTIGARDYSTTDFSVTAWVKFPGGNAGTLIGAHSAVASENPTFDLLITAADKLRLLVRQDSVPAKRWDADSAAIATGVWRHVAATFDASGPTAVFYVDGVATSQTVNNNNAMDGVVNLAAVDLRIGQRGGDSVQTYDGEIEDLRYYPRILTAGEVSSIALAHGRDGVLGADLHFPMVGQDGLTVPSAGDLVDLSGNGYSGTALSGTAPAYSAGPTMGMSQPRPLVIRRPAPAVL